MLDVAVIGAGPAGLCAAAALSRCRAKPLRVEVSIAENHDVPLGACETVRPACEQYRASHFASMFDKRC